MLVTYYKTRVQEMQKRMAQMDKTLLLSKSYISMEYNTEIKVSINFHSREGKDAVIDK
jgi:hypothetical protein